MNGIIIAVSVSNVITMIQIHPCKMILVIMIGHTFFIVLRDDTLSLIFYVLFVLLSC